LLQTAAGRGPGRRELGEMQWWWADKCAHVSAVLSAVLTQRSPGCNQGTAKPCNSPPQSPMKAT
jgi:hypothetical protein